MLPPLSLCLEVGDIFIKVIIFLSDKGVQKALFVLFICDWKGVERMKKPMIGVVPLVDIKRESYWMLPGYMSGIEQAGGIPIILPLTSNEEIIQQLVNQFDLPRKSPAS